MKKLHEKKISEIDVEIIKGNRVAIPTKALIYRKSLKQWAIAVVKESKSIKYDEQGYAEGRIIINFLIDRFEITKEELK